RLQLQVFYWQLKKDFKKAVEVCDNWIEYLEAHPKLSTPVRKAHFLMHKTESFFLLKNYNDSAKAGELCMEIYPAGNQNWYTVMEINFLTGLHTNRFEQAVKLY